ncbi:ABC transporter permease [Fulvivirgaceae bacterium LMO-SS25]
MTEEKWDLEIAPQRSLLDIPWKDIWRYRDLLMLFVRRDFVSQFKQTILGPTWFFIQPILTTVVFMVVFTGIAKISTDGVPPTLFYLSGLVGWNYFADCLNKTSNTFIGNANIFGKVYFPRIVVPISIVLSNLMRFGVQFLLFLVVWLYYLITTDQIFITIYILLVPIAIINIGLIGLGLGMIVSSLTTKYRDLTFLIAFGVQLLMYATPVIYPYTEVEGKFRLIIQANPLTPLIESFRQGFMGQGVVEWNLWIYSTVFMLVTLAIGTLIFNKVEKDFMDTV